MVDLLEQLPLVAMSEMVDRERRHNEVVTSFCSGQRLARVIHGPRLETALFPREASARHSEHLHREVHERHPRPRKLPCHHRAEETRPGPKVEHSDLLLFPERDALQHGPVEAVEAGHELPPGPIVVPRSVPEHCLPTVTPTSSPSCSSERNPGQACRPSQPPSPPPPLRRGPAPPQAASPGARPARPSRGSGRARPPNRTSRPRRAARSRSPRSLRPPDVSPWSPRRRSTCRPPSPRNSPKSAPLPSSPSSPSWRGRCYPRPRTGRRGVDPTLWPAPDSRRGGHGPISSGTLLWRRSDPHAPRPPATTDPGAPPAPAALLQTASSPPRPSTENRL